MIEVYGYVPAWGLPCISPFVTKVINYLHMVDLDHEFKAQDLGVLDKDAPHGKLPYIIDDDGTKVHDSSTIIAYLKTKYGDKLDASLSPPEAATALAFNRLVEEHLYWSGVIQPRWRYVANGFEIYIPFIVQGAETTPPLQEILFKFRDRILEGFNGQGMGRRNDDEVFERLKDDVDALSDFLGDKPYFMGNDPHSIDASVYSTVRHIIDVPWEWPGKPYTQGKKNLVAYADRMREQYGV